MIVIALVPALFAIVGAVVFYASKQPETKQLAFACFACGLLVTLFTLANHVIRIG